MSRNLLVVGAGLAQLDGIHRAVEQGFHVIATDGDPSAPGLKAAHEGFVLDVLDLEAHLRMFEGREISGVVSYASDITLPTVLGIRRHLGTPGLGGEPLRVSLDKGMQRGAFQREGLSQPGFTIGKSFEEIWAGCEDLRWPLVLKPVDSAGSRGVTAVRDEAGLKEATALALEHSKKGEAIAEEYVEGTELTVEGFSVGGEHRVLAVSDKIKKGDPRFRVATQLAYPAKLTRDTRTRVEELVVGALDAAGVDNSPTHCEVIVPDDGSEPKLVEIGCRGGGFFVFTRIVELSSGYDPVGNWNRLCVGDTPEEIVALDRGAVLRFLVAPPGRLKEVRGLEAANGLEGVQAGMFVSEGEMVPPLETDGSRTGWIVSWGEGREEALEKADLAEGFIEMEVET